MSSPGSAPPSSTYANEIRVLLSEVARRWWFVLLGCVIGAVAAFVTTRFVPTPFEATAVLAVRPASAQGASAGISLMTKILESRQVATRALSEVGPSSMSADEYLAQHQSVENAPGTFLLELRVRAEDPAWAARMANAVSRIGTEEGARLLESHPSVEIRRERLKQELEQARRALDALPVPALPAPGAVEPADAFKRRLEYERASELVKDLSSRLVAFETDIDLIGAELAVVDPAVPPAARLSPRTAEDTFAGALVGACLGLFAAGLAGLWRAVHASAG